MSHLARAGLLLALFVVMLLFMRSISATVSVEQIGVSHTDNPREWASRAVFNQDSAVCAECHESTNASWKTSAHATLTCEDCHGPTRDHIAQARIHEDAPLALVDARDLCLTCHAELSARPAEFPQVNSATHGVPAEGVRTSCTSCHRPHDPGIPPAITHELDGRPQCLVCHGPEEWQPLSISHADIPESDCLRCHSLEEGT